MQYSTLGAVVQGALALYYWYCFEQMAERPSTFISKIQSIHISKRKLAGGVGAILTLYQILSQSLGIPQNFWIGLCACLGIAGTLVYLLRSVSGLGELGKTLLSAIGCSLIFAYSVGPLKMEWHKENAPHDSMQPVVRWTDPAAITFGTPLSTDQLNATALIEGSFAYTPGIGTILPVGQQQVICVFTPKNKQYALITRTVNVLVNPARKADLLNAAQQPKMGPKNKSKTLLAKTGTPNPEEPSLPKGSLILSVSLISPSEPAIVVENQSDSVAEGIAWELVMFRSTDLAFFSYPAQNIGYVKAHSKSAPYTMQLNTLPHAPGTGQVMNGDSFMGTIAVDCPLCKGTTLIVNFVWGRSGWFYEVPEGGGKLILPRDMTKELITKYFESLSTTIKPENRNAIQ
jgi:hypothetical protein